MPNYPNWKRKLAQTQFSLGSNPRLGTTLPNKISKRQRILGILTYRKDYTGMRPRNAICDSHYGLIVITASTSALQAESRGSIPRRSTHCKRDSV